MKILLARSIGNLILNNFDSRRKVQLCRVLEIAFRDTIARPNQWAQMKAATKLCILAVGSTLWYGS
jgi:hypothetical protein